MTDTTAIGTTNQATWFVRGDDLEAFASNADWKALTAAVEAAQNELAALCDWQAAVVTAAYMPTAAKVAFVPDGLDDDGRNQLRLLAVLDDGGHILWADTYELGSVPAAAHWAADPDQPEPFPFDARNSVAYFLADTLDARGPSHYTAADDLLDGEITGFYVDAVYLDVPAAGRYVPPSERPSEADGHIASLVENVRVALSEADIDLATVVGVAFTTREYDNGFFLEDPAEVFQTDGTRVRLDTSASEDLTELYGCVGPGAYVVVNPTTGAVHDEEYGGGLNLVYADVERLAQLPC